MYDQMMKQKSGNSRILNGQDKFLDFSTSLGTSLLIKTYSKIDKRRNGLKILKKRF